MGLETSQPTAITDADARAALVKLDRAWGYGPVRTAPVDDVARAMLLTLAVEEGPTLVIDPAKASELQRPGVEGVSGSTARQGPSAPPYSPVPLRA